MRISRIASAILILAPLALAKLPVPNGILGRVEGALDFCSQADSGSVEKYQAKKREFVQGATGPGSLRSPRQPGI
jgi:hypothetical protein